jgi:predicted enzyme related to lactoylglutathione lyase
MYAKYAHTNLIAHDWRRLAEFYFAVFGCVVVPPERNYRGAEIEAATGIPGVQVQGAHLRLPGYGENGPTLEIFQYNTLAPAGRTAVNRPGFAHIAFEVEDVAKAREQVLAHGGRTIGEVVTLTTRAGRRVTVCYVTDPESNGIELQCWSAA